MGRNRDRDCDSPVDGAKAEAGLEWTKWKVSRVLRSWLGGRDEQQDSRVVVDTALLAITRMS